MAPGQPFDLKFNVEIGGGERVTLCGAASFDAAVFCASLTAARRVAATPAARWARRRARVAAAAKRFIVAALFGVPPGAGMSIVDASVPGRAAVRAAPGRAPGCQPAEALGAAASGSSVGAQR
ncbi:hypothetical protein MNEG_3654 [Monoraphidium neglectum]|jgi:hypothetical protein|uniref:Uncharacterized protein n=1 Tax=Monoraphidium neglectum TaxID=145388 RepID=A0A0D2K120_9CHLO|nr:hypothetical protein MNEG_3654 [Monoraphidium neglectum]KIZ04308.1 hypothetical protein MNEG_3654 [Monoraphidium neglectum]|eukprot:XP_013903327.1 hypothetical protein MNEG_3654 [Monoraphidium neglectum]